jgi:hypothetical protein
MQAQPRSFYSFHAAGGHGCSSAPQRLDGVYFPTYFLGLASSLGIVLAAREEHRLEILLAKPVLPSQFIMARALPVLASAFSIKIGAVEA